MRGSRKVVRSKSRPGRTIHVSPITHAVRAALAASALALAGTGAAWAGDCSAPPADRSQAIACATGADFAGAEFAGLNAPVVDLTTVADGTFPSAVADIRGSGIAALDAAFTVNIVNSGPVDRSGSGDVIGIDADFGGADIAIVNTEAGSIRAESVDGLADGIFAYGAEITVDNHGAIEADGYTWAAGIEAQGDTVTINNDGDIVASASANVPADPATGADGVYGHAYGIYAVSYGDDGTTVNNRGTISASGVYATGVYAYDAGIGGIAIGNHGDITATADQGIAAGVRAISSFEGSDIDVVNDGGITATGTYGASGIAVGATGLGSSASVDNRGDVYAGSTVYYSLAEGIAVTADGDASLDNSGTVTIGYGDYAYGALALAFAGDADAHNSGDVSVNGGLLGYGVLAASQNGEAQATNAGSITVAAAWSTATGLAASSMHGTSVSNSGTIAADASTYGFGIRAGASLGDTDVANSGDISVTSGKYAFGVLAQSTEGDVSIDNSGTIATDGKYSFGVQAQSSYGDVIVDNAGTIASSGKYAYGAVAASSSGDATISNCCGAISAYSSDLLAVGAFANANYDGEATIDNAGLIDATGTTYAALAYGAVVQTDAGGGLVSNGDTGLISAANSYGVARGVIVRSSAGGDSEVANAGGISAITTGSGVVENYDGSYTLIATDAIGVYAYAPGATASVHNSGVITASSASGLADGVFAAGAEAEVINSGSITADGYTWGAGIEAQGDDASTVTNTGDIAASATAYAPADPEAGTGSVYGRAYGVYASAGGTGGVEVDNHGSIGATGVYATGVYAYDAGTGGIGISNRGDVTATADNGVAAGIEAVTAFADSAIEISNRGSIASSGYNAAYAISAIATGQGSGVEVSNAGAISAAAADTKYGIAAGVIASGDGDVEVRNTRAGTIAISGGYSYGLAAMAFAGDAEVTNAGDIAVEGKYAYGIVSSSQNSGAGAVNSGDVEVLGSGVISSARGIDASGVDAEVLNAGTSSAYGKYSRGINAVASSGDSEVFNAGSAYGGGKYSYGIVGISAAGDVQVTNAGSAEAYSSATVAVGVLGISTSGDVGITNTGSVEARGDYAGLAAGVYASSDSSDVEVFNVGSIDASTLYNAFGVLANIGGDGELRVVSVGDISAASMGYDAVGIDASSAYGGEVSLRNSGAITASTTSGNATGMAGTVAGGGLALVNSFTGSIEAGTVDGDATGMLGVVTDADVTVVNAGSITATSTHGNAYAIRIEAAAPLAPAADETGTARETAIEPLIDRSRHLVPAGSAAADGTAAIAATGTTTLVNSGSIVAVAGKAPGIAVYGSDGVERILNSGTISGALVGNGGGDEMWNLGGGTWSLAGDATDFGAGDDRLFNARGGTLSLADAGITFGAGDNRFHNMGTVEVAGIATVDMAGGGTPRGVAAFTNDGIIDFLDGAADDRLTITGSFAGRGAVNLDVSLGSELNDQLFVQGDIGRGTRQVVNVALLDGLPKSSDVGTQLQLVHVSGDTSPSAFVAGDVLGVSPRDFLSMGMTLTTRPDTGAAAGAGSSYMLGVETFVSGLNAAGVLASSTALAVDSLMASTAGDRLDRTYMTARGGQPVFASLTPWVRGFSDEGGMSPDHLAGNFGQLAHSRLNQDNAGTEMGLEYRAGNGFRFGAVFAKSEGRQYLVDDRGMNTIRGSTMGLYGTWVAPGGFYVDASWRSMQFRTSLDSIGGLQRSDGQAFSTRLELGRAWTFGNGLTIAPQMRYTSTLVDGLSIEGDQATFESQDAQWKRASAGISLWKSFGAGGWQWRPYGEVDVVETLQGVSRYAINQDYFGNVMTEGTSALVKFGVGAQKGRLSWNSGLNWIDGAGFDGGMGGQMSLQYAW